LVSYVFLDDLYFLIYQISSIFLAPAHGVFVDLSNFMSATQQGQKNEVGGWKGKGAAKER
jgi:hypothetical protein